MKVNRIERERDDDTRMKSGRTVVARRIHDGT